MNEMPRRRRRIAPIEGPDLAPQLEPPVREIPRDEAQRPEPRQAPRELTSREEADKLSNELLERDDLAGDFIDKFPMPSGGPPDGWAYNWKKKSVLGFEDRAYAIQMATSGWRPVPAARHPEFMPSAGNYLAIEREGMILMEIPLQVKERRDAMAYNRAREQIRLKQQQMNAAPAGTFERDNKGASLVNIRRGYEPLNIPTDRPK
jgi:hypothetical protein